MKRYIIEFKWTLPTIGIYTLALNDKKKNYYRHMTLGQDSMSGFIITLILTTLSPFMQWLSTYVISPEYFSSATEQPFCATVR